MPNGVAKKKKKKNTFAEASDSDQYGMIETKFTLQSETAPTKKQVQHRSCHMIFMNENELNE